MSQPALHMFVINLLSFQLRDQGLLLVTFVRPSGA